MIPTTNPTKKQRALPRVWARFFSLKASETFTHGGKRYYKSAIPCIAVQLNHTEAKHWLFFPWERVQTDVLVRDARPGGKSSVQTVGAIQYANWETAGGTTPEQNESREFVKQPNSDNGESCNRPRNIYNTDIGRIKQLNSDNGVSGPTS